MSINAHNFNNILQFWYISIIPIYNDFVFLHPVATLTWSSSGNGSAPRCPSWSKPSANTKWRNPSPSKCWTRPRWVSPERSTRLLRSRPAGRLASPDRQRLTSGPPDVIVVPSPVASEASQPQSYVAGPNPDEWKFGNSFYIARRVPVWLHLVSEELKALAAFSGFFFFFCSIWNPKGKKGSICLVAHRAVWMFFPHFDYK